MTMPLTTTVVGSYPQPGWLVDREKLAAAGVPRVRRPEIWRVPAERLEEAQDDAVRLALADMEQAGVDILSDGEQRRESYFNQFATRLTGIDPERAGPAMGTTGSLAVGTSIVGSGS